VLSYDHLRSLKPAAHRARQFANDVLVPGLKVMVTDTGHLSYGMKRRWPGQGKQPTWRKIGDVYIPPKRKTADTIDGAAERLGAGIVTLAEARTVARSWLDALARGLDPKVEAALRDAAARAQAESEARLRFAAICADFSERHVATLAKAKEVQRIVDNIYVAAWGERSATNITPQDVAALIEPIAKATPYWALEVFRVGSRIYSWAMQIGKYQIAENPFSNISPKALIGDTPARQRVLYEPELARIWHAAPRLGQHGDIVRILMLNGKRLKEIGQLAHPEIDFARDQIIIPGRRMKGRDAPDHLVPLTPETKQILTAISRGRSGEFVFSTTDGEKALWGFADDKKKDLDKLAGVTGWKLHDLRRTFRSAMPKLGITREIAERLVNHVSEEQSVLDEIYDRYEYIDEKRDALLKWEAHIAQLLARH